MYSTSKNRVIKVSQITVSGKKAILRAISEYSGVFQVSCLHIFMSYGVFSVKIFKFFVNGRWYVLGNQFMNFHK